MADPLQSIAQIGQNDLPKINLPKPPTQPGSDYGALYKSLTTQQPTMSGDVLPYIVKTMQAPVESLKESTAQNVAAAQSGAMQRGMAGSDIEAAGMAGARATGAQQIADMHANISNQLAQYIMQAYGMDIQANTQMFQNIAQAIGQKLSMDQEYNMFIQQLGEMGHEAASSRQAELLGAGIGALGTLGAGAIIKSDERLKTNKIKIGDINGLGLYIFEYRQDLPEKLPPGKRIGFMAQEVEKKFPEAVKEFFGYKAIDLNILSSLMEVK